MPGITYNHSLKCLEDKNGNQAYVAWFGSPERAKRSLQGLDSCTNCVNCTDCAHCTDCTDCKYCMCCVGATNCRDCEDCTNCKHCTDCKYCKYCRGCEDCANCPGLSYINGWDRVVSYTVLGNYRVYVGEESTKVGCKEFTNLGWLKFTDQEVSSFAPDALEWWGKHKKALHALINTAIEGAKTCQA